MARANSLFAKPHGLPALLSGVPRRSWLRSRGSRASRVRWSFASDAPSYAVATMITMLGYEPARGSSQILEDELLVFPVAERELRADAGDVKEWLEDKWHELKKLARV